MGLLKKFRKYVTGKKMEWPLPFKEDRLLSDINVRDPYIVLDEQGGYILAGTIYRLNFNDSYGTVIFKSKDKEHWSGPYLIVEKDSLDKEYKDFWAPEIHKFNDMYLLLVTLTPKGENRGTYLFTSNTLDGKYSMRCRVTPKNQISLDGTFLYENGQLYITYCYGYTGGGNGKISCVKLKNDFSGIDETSEKILFYASDNQYKLTHSHEKVTDGPFYFHKDGNLYMLWSTDIAKGKYVQLVAKSDNNSILGNWTQLQPIFVDDGGHGMIFTDYDNKQKLVLHSPNKRTILDKKYETPLILDLPELKEY